MHPIETWHGRPVYLDYDKFDIFMLKKTANPAIPLSTH